MRDVFEDVSKQVPFEYRGNNFRFGKNELEYAHHCIIKYLSDFARAATSHSILHGCTILGATPVLPENLVKEDKKISSESMILFLYFGSFNRDEVGSMEIKSSNEHFRS